MAASTAPLTQPFSVITLTTERLGRSGPERSPSQPTLQVRERVQGRLVSGSWTPQCLLGSNTLPGKQQTDSADWTQPIPPRLPGKQPGWRLSGNTSLFCLFSTAVGFDAPHALGSVGLSVLVRLTPTW